MIRLSRSILVLLSALALSACAPAVSPNGAETENSGLSFGLILGAVAVLMFIVVAIADSKDAKPKPLIKDVHLSNAIPDQVVDDSLESSLIRPLSFLTGGNDTLLRPTESGADISLYRRRVASLKPITSKDQYQSLINLDGQNVEAFSAFVDKLPGMTTTEKITLLGVAVTGGEFDWEVALQVGNDVKFAKRLHVKSNGVSLSINTSPQNYRFVV